MLATDLTPSLASSQEILHHDKASAAAKYQNYTSEFLTSISYWMHVRVNLCYSKIQSYCSVMLAASLFQLADNRSIHVPTVHSTNAQCFFSRLGVYRTHIRKRFRSFLFFSLRKKQYRPLKLPAPCVRHACMSVSLQSFPLICFFVADWQSYLLSKLETANSKDSCHAWCIVVCTLIQSVFVFQFLFPTANLSCSKIFCFCLISSFMAMPRSRWLFPLSLSWE